MEQGNSSESRLDGLFRAYREACPDPEASVNFTPEMWARIEAREISTNNWFRRVAKVLVTTAVAASVVLGMMVSSANRSTAFFNATFVDALQADQVAALEPLHVDRLSKLRPR